MVKFDRKRVGQTVMSLGGNGVGQVLVAVAAALLVRLFSGPEPALLPDYDIELEDGEKEDGDIELCEEPPASGKVMPVTIRWCNISCSLSEKSSESVRWLLKNVSGEAKPGRLLAIMGPSGSGKTTLLNILAGQLAASPRLHLSGIIDFNGKADSNKRAYRLAYVRQEDLFFSQLTVRETLTLAAELQLTEISSVEEREEYVNNLLLKLGLVNCAESCVGDARVRGISGGEKKRLSLACELIASPSVIFADEPTTGLDAFQAEKVVETLQQLAKDGHTVICSIHQPRGSVYSKFDDIILLTEGALVYAGPAHEEPLEYFSKFGYNCPDHVNPAEFLADLISIDYSSADSVYFSQKRICGLVESFSRYSSTILYANPIEKKQVLAGKNFRKSKKGGWWRQFCLLLNRAWMQASRDGPTNKVRARMSIASAIIFGSVFWRMGRSQTSIQDRMGLLQVAAINTAMAALTKTVGVFPKERAIVDRERAKGSYTLGPYLLSKLLAEIPIGAAFPLVFGAILYPMARLNPSVSRFGKFCTIVTVESFAASAMGLTVGAMVPSTEAAMAVGPSLMTVFIVFGGYYVNADNTPIIFRWIPSVSLIRWAFQGLCINEFKGLQFDCQHSFDVQTGEQALERLSFGGSRIRDTLIAQSRILLFLYYTTYLLLEKNKPKYQQLEPPPKLLIETFDSDNLHQTEHEGDLETFDDDNLDKTQPEGDLQMETFDNENLEKTQPVGTNENLEKNQAEGDLQINSFDKNNMEKPQPEEPPSLDKVESKDDNTETPQIDQIRPFILEGAK
ncbi:ABC transporter G family member 7 isoform X1 [Cucumis melo var. makuwa]|uniref:ABC transporter G family member 7 isoform X1 n=2 Tax=Cucumis melo TaxID=3656 RepID=A0A5D3CD83_CUCMM|nr:ABC transporter G family member 7 [Cucumis melo]TYK09164.1 ABC transporter G family member 7 isoform X1 [Cucumis melo var. makuwa]